MQLGAVLPSGEIGVGPADAMAYATGLETLDFAHVAAYEHVLGADIAARPDWRGPYTAADPFREPLVLFAFMAALTTSLSFATSVLILPQRQTALVAKQAAEVALLSGGRFRLGVGIGWNAVEYEALGVPWERRGRRLEEQIEVLRQLWSNASIDFAGEFHTITAAGINPLPSALVPLWLGGGEASDRVLERIARLADGWMVPFHDGREAASRIALLRERRMTHRSDPIGIEGRMVLRQLGADRSVWRQAAEAWRDAGATHLSVATHGMGCSNVADHLELLAEVQALITDGAGSITAPA
jgi:probable F420-dependent oxidoreductase